MSSLSAATTSTSTLVAARSKVSWITMPSPCWPEPGISIGSRCQSLDPLGRYKCWNLREKSPAFVVWRSVSKAITSLLDDQFEHLETRGSEFMVEMFMVGKKPASAAPTILFSCDNKYSRQKAMDLVEKKSILAKHPGVRMAQCSRLPRPLALGDDTASLTLPEGIYSYGLVESCALSVLIVATDYAPPKTATIGGFICIDNEYYGLTSAHAFSETKAAPGVDHDFEFAFYGQSEPDDSSDEDDLEMTSKGSVSSLSSRSGGVLIDTDNLDRKHQSSVISSSDSLDSGPDNTDARKSSHEPPASNKPPTRIGVLHALPPPGSSLDWALVKINFNMLISASMLHYGVKEILSQRICDIVNNVISNKEEVVYTVRTAVVPADASVMVRIASGESPEPGILSAATSWKRGPGERKFQELLKVTLERGRFVDGDCGSWVVNEKNGHVYGHVVSGFPENGTAYLVPAWQILQEIEESQLGSHVGFPSTERLATCESLSLTGASTVRSPIQPVEVAQPLPMFPTILKDKESEKHDDIVVKKVTTSSSKAKAKPAYMYEVDEIGNPIEGTRRSARTEKATGLSRRSTQGSVTTIGSLESTASTSSTYARLAERPISKSTPKSKSNVSERNSDEKSKHKKEKKVKTESKHTTRLASVHGNKDSPRTGVSKSDSSYYGIPTSMATGSPSARPTPIINPNPVNQQYPISQPIPLRPRAITGNTYPNRPTSYHAAYGGGYGAGPPLSASAFYQQPSFPTPFYPPPSPSSSYMRYAPTPQQDYFTPNTVGIRPLSQRFGAVDPIQRTSSAYGIRDPPPHQKLQDTSEDGYTSASEGLATRRTAISRVSRSSGNPNRNQSGFDINYDPYNDFMPPMPPARPGILRNRTTEYSPDPVHGDRGDGRYSPPPRARRNSISYDIQRPDERVRVEVANNTRRRQSYYERPASPELHPRTVEDTMSWPTPQTSLEEKRKHLEKQRSERDVYKEAGTSSNMPRPKDRWTPLPYTPSVVFDTPLAMRGRGGTRSRRGGGIRRDNTDRTQNSSTLTTKERPNTSKSNKRSTIDTRSQENTSDGLGKSYEDFAREAQVYQEDIGGPTTPLTADVLRRQQRRGLSRSSSHSSVSRDESDYRKSATTRTTRSTVGSDDENVTIKVSGQSRVVVGGAQLDYIDGGEIEIRRQKSIRNGSERSKDSGYGSTSGIDSRRSHVNQPPGQGRDRNQPYPPTGGYF